MSIHESTHTHTHTHNPPGTDVKCLPHRELGEAAAHKYYGCEEERFLHVNRMLFTWETSADCEAR